MTSSKTKTEKKKKNKYKNRFRDVIPYDTTRVQLEKIGDDESTTYINASWVHDILYDFRGDKERVKRYISAMGPIRRKSDYEAENVNTCPDFWRMIWENNVEVIVMLTRLSEDLREMEKCSKYWPKVGESEKHDNGITVITDAEDGDSEKEDTIFVTRRFTLQRGDDKKNVVQVQYIEWPDHGVPKNEDHFIELTKKVDGFNSNDRPLLVHCSAGVGRSGTFCAVHSLVRYYNAYSEHKEKETGLPDLPDVDIPQRLIELRKDRPKMIQTKEQYEFVYRAIYKVFGQKFEEFERRRKQKEEEKKE